MTQASQPLVRFVPVLHSSCAHCLVHDWPQIDPTSPTQIESHEVVQQYESAAQILVTHASQPLASAAPVSHSPCAHIAVPWHLPLASQLCPVGQVPHEPEQPSEPHCLLVHVGVQVPPVTMQLLALFDHCVCTT